jgi:hypothetical protein
MGWEEDDGVTAGMKGTVKNLNSSTNLVDACTSIFAIEQYMRITSLLKL